MLLRGSQTPYIFTSKWRFSTNKMVPKSRNWDHHYPPNYKPQRLVPDNTVHKGTNSPLFEKQGILKFDLAIAP